METTSLSVQNGRAGTIRKTFSRETSVNIRIEATSAIIWALLANAPNYPKWNSTVVSIEGNIAQEQEIKLKSTLDPKRIFKLKVKEFVPENKLVWGDAIGSRVYTLNKRPDNSVLFSMSEKIGGPLFPLFAKMIPSFDSSFEQFAADLKKEAEKIMNAK
ncbi:MAG TPA: SRPBCC domain-containing protein [Mucilaginibacter sp.]|jgi:hypothetical protein